ncbi:MAG: hypothetical protein ACRDD2_03230 [Sarcina sp.]
MANGKLYRSFIILQEDERGHSLANDKPLSGYAKVEVKNEKCKVAFYAQNLKKEYSKCSMMLICCKKEVEVLLNLGSMNITPQGKAESSIEFDANNIGNTGISYDKVVGATLAKEDGTVAQFLMCGFLNGEKPTSNWKDYKKLQCSNEKMAPKKAEESKPSESKSAETTTKKETSPKVSTPVQKPKVEEDPKNNENCSCPKSRNKYDEYENYIDNSDALDSDIGRYKPIEEDDFELRGTVGEFFERVVTSLEPTKCSNEIKKCKWFKVPVKSFDTMCNMADYNKYTALYHPMTHYYPYIAKEEHFIVGLKCDEYGVVKYLVYGIKGGKDKSCQPYDGKTGFVTWAPTEGNSNMGYWLMFYDFKNSVIVVPSK